jgi:2-polyprenyl-6-hydroxyphenyl methylase/3-demethylubiquinone-9 3-methyltransferase
MNDSIKESTDFRQYDFGRNWRTFLDIHLTPERIDEACDSLRRFLNVDTIEGRTFLDIGCGSGLFSYAAHLLGAEKILSIDVNPNSVDCCRTMIERANTPENWSVELASVLDSEHFATIDKFDIVYSWGVLHHTGAMWTAIRNAAGRVKPGGRFYIAIYNRADGLGIYSDGRAGSSRFWVMEKAVYVRLPELLQRVVDGAAATALVISYLLTLRNPVREIREHKTLRGMSWMVDIRDWLGGYPYEYASVEEIFSFVHGELGFELENLKSTNSLMNNEFLFRRPSAATSAST